MSNCGGWRCLLLLIHLLDLTSKVSSEDVYQGDGWQAPSGIC